jgi:hypothetical protein
LYTGENKYTGDGRLIKRLLSKFKQWNFSSSRLILLSFLFFDSGRVAFTDAPDFIKGKNLHAFSGRAVYGGFGELRDRACGA